MSYVIIRLYLNLYTWTYLYIIQLYIINYDGHNPLNSGRFVAWRLAFKVWWLMNEMLSNLWSSWALASVPYGQSQWYWGSLSIKIDCNEVEDVKMLEGLEFDVWCFNMFIWGPFFGCLFWDTGNPTTGLDISSLQAKECWSCFGSLVQHGQRWRVSYMPIIVICTLWRWFTCWI